MKKSLIVVTLAALASLSFVAGALADNLPPPGADIIGIYTGQFTGATPTTWAHYEGSGPQVTVYIVYSGITQTGIAGWETQVNQDGTGVMFLSATLFGLGPINLFAAPTFQVGLGVPMTTAGPNGTWPVASMLYFVTGTTPTTLSVGAIEFTSWPEDPGPGYADAVDVGILQRATTYTGDLASPVFGFNTGPLVPPVKIEEETWGGVKGMFR